MNSSRRVDYIIVGQGLAGSCMALQSLWRNKRIVVFDQPLHNHATSVAAGLINPIAGRVMAKTWLADILFPYLISFYNRAEDLLKQKFFHSLPLYRPFVTVQEQNEWMRKSAEISIAGYIAKIFLESAVAEVRDPFGGLLLQRSGHVDVTKFVDAVRSHLISLEAYREEQLDEDQLCVNDDEVTYKDLVAKEVIFCNGIEANKSRYFSWLPVNPLKGETLSVRMDFPNVLCNRGVYIVPAPSRGEFTVGATYDFRNQTPGVTTAGRDELETKLRELVTVPFTVTGQNWGIRPTTAFDQRIILGRHPRWKKVMILNGLGTKGVTLAPYFSGQLLARLEGEMEIMQEVNIDRFKPLYSKFE